ncbi:uncharacterized protein PAC_19055 [Phialocephala subalpina]|uniref:Uncharacterized protein n=1 Tax=Phialocephala subalpina TaxID=576137 RepID=A0A1L7XW01_9HELO|nr:uncharacterized protein PAC_19055 [Phialocephala subalpina]
MSLESASLHRWRSIFVILLLIAVFHTICHVSPDYSPDVVHLHEVLTRFTTRGQATVELFAPWSTIAASSPDSYVFLTIASDIAWSLVGAMFLRMLEEHKIVSVNSPSTRTVLYSFLAGIAWYSNSERHKHLLTLVNEVADAFLTLALVTITAWEDHPRWLRGLLFLGLGDALILSSYALGSNDVDAVAAYILLCAARARIIARKVADCRFSIVSILFEGVSHLSISFIIWPMSIMLITGALLPMSESAAGGNYNLRYLSADARRDLSPFPVIRPSSPQAGPGFGLRHGTAYTLYVPGAGFLWSDSMIWNQSLPEGVRNSTSQHDDAVESRWSVEGSYRVFFQDKFIERYPWEVRSAPGLSQGRPSRYLCVIPGERVVSEAGYFNMDENEKSRIRVGTNPNPASPHCDWTTYYDPMEDDGITFYNHEHQCSLGSTFRSVPDPEHIQSNDTMLRILNLKLEASCTASASEASSRLFLVESTSRVETPGSAKGPSNQGQSLTNGWFRRAVHYLQARRRLDRVRKYHGHLQDEVGTAINDIGGKTRPLDLWKPDILMCILYLLVWVTGVLHHRRFRGNAANLFGNDLPAHSQLGSVFVMCHIIAYYILGVKMLHSSRAAGLVSLYGFTEYAI